MRENFRQLDAILAKYQPATGEKAPATGEKAPATDEKAPATDEKTPATDEKTPAKDQDGGIREALIEQEGERLVTNLQTLTATGDVSLTDAKTLVDAFIKRAQCFAGVETGFKGGALEAMARCFGELPKANGAK